MTTVSPRRWYQFRLSTILVLVAITAWAMALRPWWVPHFEEVKRVEWPNRTTNLTVVERQHLELVQAIGNDLPTTMTYWERREILNPRLKWPLLNLATLLAWKLVRAVVSRRKREGST